MEAQNQEAKVYEYEAQYLIINHLQQEYVLFFKDETYIKNFLNNALNFKLVKKHPIVVLSKGKTIINSYFNVPFIHFLLIKVNGKNINHNFPRAYIGTLNEDTGYVFFDNLWEFGKKFFKNQKSFYASSFSLRDKSIEIWNLFKESQSKAIKENKESEIKIGDNI